MGESPNPTGISHAGRTSLANSHTFNPNGTRLCGRRRTHPAEVDVAFPHSGRLPQPWFKPFNKPSGGSPTPLSGGHHGPPDHPSPSPRRRPPPMVLPGGHDRFFKDGCRCSKTARGAARASPTRPESRKRGRLTRPDEPPQNRTPLTSPAVPPAPPNAAADAHDQADMAIPAGGRAARSGGPPPTEPPLIDSPEYETYRVRRTRSGRTPSSMPVGRRRGRPGFCRDSNRRRLPFDARPGDGKYSSPSLPAGGRENNRRRCAAGHVVPAYGERNERLGVRPDGLAPPRKIRRECRVAHERFRQ